MKHLHHIYAAALIAATALVATACSSEGDAPEVPADGADADAPSYILFGLGTPTGISWTHYSESRAGSPVASSIPEAVGVFGYNNFSGGQSYQGGGEVFNNTMLYWREGSLFASSGITTWPNNPNSGTDPSTDGQPNLWPYTPPMPWLNEDDGVDYKFFAYAPYCTYGTDISVYGRSYESFESVVWRHIPKYSSTDYMISSRIVEYSSRPSGNALQVIPMTHLQARIRFCFKLGDKFSTLRMIRVKKVEVVSLRGFLYTLTARYTTQPTGVGDETALLPTTAWIVEEASDVSDQLLVNEMDPATLLPIPYIELSRDYTDYQALASIYAYPGDNLTGLDIRVTYDVYDYYPDQGKAPVLLRENDVAQNTIPLSFRSSQSTSGTGPRLMPGYYYDVKIKIEPDYLYVLSDNDFDTDGYLIINDN